MDPADCQVIRAAAARAKAEEDRQQAYIDEQNRRFEAERERRKTADEATRARREQAASDQRAQREAEIVEMQRQRDAETAAEERREAQAVAALKARCGADYKAPRVGMSVERVEQCVTRLKMAGQLNRADGVVTTYRAPSGAFFHVMDGKVVAWGLPR